MSDKREANLDDLIGEHELDAVDTFIERIKKYGDYFEDANAIRFRLDGVTYTALEDPSDGYRSSLERLFVSAEEKMQNVFPAIRVLARKKPNSDWQVNETLELIDIVTGKTVLEVGTDNTDDYYPSFVGSFWPENMATNQECRPANDDMVQGYMDGFDLSAPEPSANRSESYRHGFANGRADKTGKSRGYTFDQLNNMADEAMERDDLR